jgi:hypothetical protein
LASKLTEIPGLESATASGDVSLREVGFEFIERGAKDGFRFDKERIAESRERIRDLAGPGCVGGAHVDEGADG